MKNILKIIVMMFLFSILAVNARCAVLTLVEHHGGGLTSVTVKTYVNNAGTMTLVDSSVISVFPNDTSIILNDSADYQVLRGWLFDGETDTLWAVDYIPTNSRATIDFPGQLDTIGYTAWDTVGAGSAIAGVQVDVFTDLSLPRKTSGITDVNGHISFSLATGDTYYFLGYNPFLYFWHQDSVIHTGDTEDSIYGYSVTFPVASTDSTCAVSILVVNPDGTAANGIAIMAKIVGSFAIDSTGRAIRNTSQRKKTNAQGYVTFQCIWSSFMIPETKWLFTSSALGGMRQEYIVPRQAVDTLQLTR